MPRVSKKHVLQSAPTEFHEPPVPANSFKLKSTGQDIEEFPNQDAVTSLESPEVLLRRSNRNTAAVVRRRNKPTKHKQQEDETDPKKSIETSKIESKLLSQLNNRENAVSESRSFMRSTKGKGTEDYRHRRLPAEDMRKAAKRVKKNTKVAERKTHSRRSTRPVFETIPVFGEEPTHEKEDENEKSESESQQEFIPMIKIKDANKQVTSPNKSDTVTANDKNEVQSKESENEKNADEIVNNDFCTSCGGTGELLCCETCANSFHFSCFEPPVMNVEEIGEGKWSCRTCSARKISDEEERNRVSQTFFGPVILDLESKNAIAYQLPLQLRKMFSHIKTSNFGEFVDEFRKSESITSGQRIHDKAGNVLLCFHCKSSGLKHPLAICSQCQTPWHIDCVNPPLESTPLGYWECPLHAGNIYKLPRKVNNPIVTSVALRRKISNDGNIEVIDSDTETEEFNKDNSNERVNAGDFEDEEVTNHINFPAKSRVLPDGTLAPKYTKLREVGSDRIVYKIPSKTIKLDFLDSVYKLRGQPYKETPQSEVILALNSLANKDDADREAVRNLMSLKLQGPAVSTAEATDNLATLIDATLDDENELGQIAAIKRLMREKGKERLLQILKDA